MDDRLLVHRFNAQLREFRGKYGRKGERGGSSKTPTTGDSEDLMSKLSAGQLKIYNDIKSKDIPIFALQGKDLKARMITIDANGKLFKVMTTPDSFKVSLAPVVGVNMDFTLQVSEGTSGSLTDVYLAMGEVSAGKLLRGK
jgi:hypothetical protein